MSILNEDDDEIKMLKTLDCLEKCTKTNFNMEQQWHSKEEIKE